MFDLNRTLFYKAKFDITADQGKDALWSLIMSIKSWMLEKAQRSGYALPTDNRTWSQFKTGARMVAQGADVELFSVAHIENDVFTWACQLNEVATQPGCAARTWITEIGFAGKSVEEACVSIVISYGDKPGFIGPLQAPPQSTVPNLVRVLLANWYLTCSVDGVEITNEPAALTECDAHAFFDLVSNPDRTMPVILANPDRAGGFPIDPAVLVSQLGPNALVYYAEDVSATDAANMLLNACNLECYSGSVRFYMGQPQIENPVDYARHRYISAKDIEERGADYVYEIARRALAQDVHFWESAIRVDDVKRLNRESSRQRAFESKLKQTQDMALEDVMGMMEDQERTNADLQHFNDLLEDELKDVKAKLAAAEGKNQYYEAAFEGGTSSEGALEELVRGMKAHPHCVADYARMLVSAFPDKIDFSQRGWRSLEECVYEPAVFWSALFDMCTILHPLYAEGCNNVAQSFNDQSTFVCKRGEGMQTHKDPKLMKEREDEYLGRAIEIETHISSKTGKPTDSKFLRIYYAWDAPSGKLVIGDTRHLTNYSTRSMR